MVRDTSIPELWHQALKWLRRCRVMLPIREHNIMIQDMIETLAAAKVAMEENPNLKAKVEHLGKSLDEMDSTHQELQAQHSAVVSARDEAINRIQKLEAELEAARFRELASNTKLDKLVSSFRGLVEEVSPTPDPVTEPVAVETAPVLTTSTSEAAPSDRIEAVSSEATQPQPDEVNVPEVKIEPERTAQAEQPTAVTEVPQPRPYANRAPSFKPESVTWPEWIDGGGNRPWWLTDGDLNKLRDGIALAS